MELLKHSGGSLRVVTSTETVTVAEPPWPSSRRTANPSGPV
jgi:hypothetical protein